jgi:hypothetical protein
MFLLMLIKTVLADRTAMNDLPTVIVAPARLLACLTGWWLVIMPFIITLLLLFIIKLLLAVRAAPDLVLLVPVATVLTHYADVAAIAAADIGIAPTPIRASLLITDLAVRLFLLVLFLGGAA